MFGRTPITSLRDSLSLYGGGVVSLVGAGGKTTLLFRLATELAVPGESILVTTTTKIFLPTQVQSPQVIIASEPDEIIRRTEALGDNPASIITAAARYDPVNGKLAGLGSETIGTLWKSRRFRWILVEADGAARRPLKAPADHEPVIPEATRWLVAVVGLDALGKPLTDLWVFRAALYAKLTGIPIGSPVTPESVSTALLDEAGIMKGCPPDARRFVFLNKADNEDHRRSGRRIAEILTARSRGRLSGILMGSAWDHEATLECFQAGCG